MCMGVSGEGVNSGMYSGSNSVKSVIVASIGVSGSLIVEGFLLGMDALDVSPPLLPGLSPATDSIELALVLATPSDPEKVLPVGLLLFVDAASSTNLSVGNTFPRTGDSISPS